MCTHSDWFPASTTQRPDVGPPYTTSVYTVCRVSWVLIARHNSPNGYSSYLRHISSTDHTIGKEVLLLFLLNPDVIDANKDFFDPIPVGSATNCFYNPFQFYSRLRVHALISRPKFRFIKS